jgi:hypothetical protein
MSEKRLPGIHEAIEKAVQSRCNDVLRGEIIKLENKMLPLMSDELRKFFDDYDSLCSLEAAEMAQACYAQGLRDGIELVKTLGGVSNA